MNSTEAFLTQFNQAWFEHDVDGVVDGVTDDIHFRMATDEEGIHGKAAFRAWLAEMANPEYKISFKTERLIVSGDDAVLAGRMEMTEPSGQQRRFASCDIYKLRNGKVASMLVYFMNFQADEGCPNRPD